MDEHNFLYVTTVKLHAHTVIQFPFLAKIITNKIK